MKKSKFVYLLILPFVIFSCSSFDKFNQFGIGNTFDESFTVTVPMSNQSFEGFVEFAASDDETIKDNIDNITAFEVTQISVKITNYSGNSEAVANGGFSVESEGVSVGDPVEISNLNLAQLYASQEYLALPLTNSTYSAIKEAYLANQTLTVTTNGGITGATEILEIEFTIFMSIEATIDTQ